MAVTGNSSDIEVLGSYSLYTGLANLRVLAINPNKAELEAMGFKPKEEPKYTGITFKQKDAEGNETSEQVRNKVVFYVGNGELKIKYEILVANEFEVASTGSQRIINKFGQFTYSKTGIEGIVNNPKMSWFDSNSARQALIGECAIIDFIREWLNVSGDQECSLDTIKSICGEANVSELKNILSKFTNNEVTCLLGVKTADNGKQYQSIYSRCFSRPSFKNAKAKFIKALDEQYGEFKDDYQNSLEFKKYEPKLDNDAPDQEEPKTTADF